MPATGLHGQLLYAGVLPCAALAVLLALAGSALYADRLARGFDARGHAMAEQLALGLSLSADGASMERLRSRSRPLFAQGFARRIELRHGNGQWIAVGDEVASLHVPSLYTSHGTLSVRVYADRAVLARAQRRIWLAGCGVTGIALVLAWLSQRWLLRRVVHPLRQLRGQLGERSGTGAARRMHELDDLRHGITALQRRMDEASHAADERIRASASEAVQHSATAQAASEGKAQFLAAVGDRLRQPLHAMHLFIGALQRNATPAQQSSIDRLQGIADAMGGLLEELLEISRLDARVVAAQSRPLAVSELFAGQQSSVVAQAQARAVAVHWHDGGLWLQGDAELLGRVLHHLLANAIEHAIGGRVLVTARCRGDRVQLEVRDNGIGIARIHQAQIFEEFFQLGGGEQRRQRRLGLGLSICARIAALLGTRIDLRSELGRGSSFRIELPRAAPVVAAEAAAMTAAPAR